MNRLLHTILLSIAACAFTANAGIINADTADYNAYEDTDTGLIWLDFGENNNQSYNYVMSALGAGGEWEGWRPPTTDEVHIMWANVANLDAVVADYENTDANGPGQFIAFDDNPDVANGESMLWSGLHSIIGHNIAEVSAIVNTKSSVGLYRGSHGLSSVALSDSTDLAADGTIFSDNIYLVENRFTAVGWRSIENEELSTLLVRDAVVIDVPEPATLAIFGLGLLGLAVRRQSR